MVPSVFFSVSADVTYAIFLPTVLALRYGAAVIICVRGALVIVMSPFFLIPARAMFRDARIMR